MRSGEIGGVGARLDREDRLRSGRLRNDVVEVLIADLRLGESPRLAGPSERHVRLLADNLGQLPPIIVDRSSMRVIDGAHRLRAAVLRDERTIQATYVDGDDDDLFVTAVEANARHGMPLSSKDRQAAARRILTTHDHWSDRAIASVVGLSPTTIGKIRRRSTVHGGQSTVRRGRDGRVRPVRHERRKQVSAHQPSEEGELEAEPSASCPREVETAGRALLNSRLPTSHRESPETLTNPRRTGRSEPKVNTSDSRSVALDEETVPSATQALRKVKADGRVMSSREARLLIQWSGIVSLREHQLNAISEKIPTEILSDVKAICDKAVAQYLLLGRALDRKNS